MKNIVFILSLLLMSASLFAEDVKFQVSAKKVVATGEQFRLVFSVNARGTNLKLPTLKDFDILSGPNSSSSSSVQFINGSMSQSVNYSYTYILSASKEGKFTIGSAQITVDGTDYQTGSFEIEVVKGATSTGSSSSTKSGGNESSGNETVQASGEDLFVRVNVSKTKVYQGEPVYANVKIYTRLDLAGFEKMELPSFTGFFVHDIESPTQFSLVRENVNGQDYNVASIKKVLLIPQRSGEISIDPCDFVCQVRQRVQSNSRSIFDNMFGRYKTVSVPVKSPVVKISVTPLPANKPAGFSGAVGDFKLSATVDNKDIMTNDAITYVIKISGTGNLKLIDPPKIDFPLDLEVYDPKVDNNITVNASGVSGNKTIEYLLIARHAGTFTIPSVKLDYFDLNSKTYKTLSTEEFVINVEKGDNEDNTTIVSHINKEDIQFFGEDIRFLKTNDIVLSPKSGGLLSSWKFYGSYLAALVLFFIIVVLRRKHIQRISDSALMKNKKANKISRKRLKSASNHLASGNKEQFYEEILKAIWGYLGDKLNIPVSELSKDRALTALDHYNIDEDLKGKFVETIDICEYARYAPLSESSQMDTIYNDADMIIGKFEQKLK